MIDLKKFCGNPSVRYDTENPFRIGDWLYATDKRIAVRIKADDSVGFPSPNLKLPDMNSVPWDHDQPHEWKKWEADRYVEENGVCPDCDGTGVVGNIRTCQYCDGEYCARCQQTGKQGDSLCSMCEGEGQCDWECVVIVGGFSISRQYFDMIRDIGEVEYAEKPEDKKPIRFRWPGGQGLIMPRDVPKEIKEVSPC